MNRLQSRQRQRSVNGFTLIEVVLIIILSAVITGIVVTSIAALFRFDRQMATHRLEQSKLVRIAETVRAELRQATICRWKKEEKSLRLELPDRRQIEYQLQDNLWIRSEIGAGGDTTKTPLGIDSEYRIEAETDVAPQGELARIGITNGSMKDSNGDHHGSRRIGVRIVAMVGGDYAPLHD